MICLLVLNALKVSVLTYMVSECNFSCSS
uniref:Uncharacterized protein n=1 Tax=Rhizophora mucronata TaxID=61149 RepID=A0A2P2J2R8_RHIMU